KSTVCTDIFITRNSNSSKYFSFSEYKLGSNKIPLFFLTSFLYCIMIHSIGERPLITYSCAFSGMFLSVMSVLNIIILLSFLGPNFILSTLYDGLSDLYSISISLYISTFSWFICKLINFSPMRVFSQKSLTCIISAFSFLNFDVYFVCSSSFLYWYFIHITS